MRVNGRTLRYSTLSERRLFMSFGIESVRVPRRMNPFAVARRLERLARTGGADAELLRSLITAQHKPRVPTGPSPDIDLPDPVETPVVPDVRAA